MRTYKNIIIAVGALAALCVAPSIWAAGGQQNQNQPNQPNNIPNPQFGVKVGCSIQAIESVGAGSFICGIQGNNLFSELYHDENSTDTNILVVAKCSTQEQKFLLETDGNSSFNWKLFYSQVLAAQLSGKRVTFGDVISCGPLDKIAKTVKLLSE